MKFVVSPRAFSGCTMPAFAAGARWGVEHPADLWSAPVIAAIGAVLTLLELYLGSRRT